MEARQERSWVKESLGAFYWVVVGATIVPWFYLSVGGDPPFFVFAIGWSVVLALVLIGAFVIGLGRAWGFFVGLGGAPALVFLNNIIEGIQSALNPHCNPGPTGKAITPGERVVECAITPGSYYVLFAIFAAIALSGVAWGIARIRSFTGSRRTA